VTGSEEAAIGGRFISQTLFLVRSIRPDNERRERYMSFTSKLTVALAAACCTLALSVGAAKADIITTFDVSGTFAGGAGGTLSGTVTLDITKLTPYAQCSYY
jgi:hypothetical protein